MLFSIAFGDIDDVQFDEAVIAQRRRVMEEKEEEDFEDDIRSAFTLIDADEDGFITTTDLYQLMMGLGEMMTDEELAQLIKVADDDKDGQLNYAGKF